MLLKALVTKNAVFDIVALVAQGVVCRRIVGARTALTGNDRWRLQPVLALEQVLQVRPVGAGGASEGSQIAAGVIVVTIAAVDIAGCRERAIGHRRPTGRNRRRAQAGHFSTQTGRKIARTSDGMVGQTEFELDARVEAIRVADIELPLRIAPVADPNDARIEELRLIGTVRVALEADFKLVGAQREKGSGGGVATRPLDRSVHPWGLSGCAVCEVGVVAIGAFSVAWRAGARLRERR